MEYLPDFWELGRSNLFVYWFTKVLPFLPCLHGPGWITLIKILCILRRWFMTTLIMHGASLLSWALRGWLELLAVFCGESASCGVWYRATTDNLDLSIFHVPKLGTKLKQDSIPLLYTPRKFITHPTNHYFYMIEGDHRVWGEEAVNKKLQELVGILSLHLNKVDHHF